MTSSDLTAVERALLEQAGFALSPHTKLGAEVWQHRAGPVATIFVAAREVHVEAPWRRKVILRTRAVGLSLGAMLADFVRREREQDPTSWGSTLQ